MVGKPPFVWLVALALAAASGRFAEAQVHHGGYPTVHNYSQNYGYGAGIGIGAYGTFSPYTYSLWKFPELTTERPVRVRTRIWLCTHMGLRNQHRRARRGIRRGQPALFAERDPGRANV